MATAPLVAAPESAIGGPISTFLGVGVGLGDYSPVSAPPDTVGDIGPNHYVQWVNTSLAVFDRSGAVLFGPVQGNTVFAGFPTTDGNRCWKNNDGDPIVLYDQLADRWLITQFDVTGPNSQDDFQCVAISTSPDPLGSYYRYSFRAPGGLFGDYEKLGVWPNAYFMTTNQFSQTGAGSFEGAGFFAFERDRMLVGDPDARQLYADMGGKPSPLAASALPADLEGFTLPTAGTPGFFAMVTGGNTFRMWRVTPNWTTATLTVSSPTSILIPAYSTIGGVIPQPDTTRELDTLSPRLMHRLAYRKFGTHEALVVTHTVNSGGIAAVRWYEVRDPNGTPTLTQSGNYPSADSIHRWMGSMTSDRFGNLAVGYSIANATNYPSIRYAGRAQFDTLGALQAEQTMWTGTGSQTNPNRWGDYSSLNVDPVDDCTFWYTQEYVATTDPAGFNWSTRVGKFKFPECSNCTAPSAPSGISIQQNSATSYTISWSSSGAGAKYNVYRSTDPCPKGAAARVTASPTSNLFYTDATAVSGTTYYYSVSAVDGTTGFCESQRSTCLRTDGSCLTPPVFAGLKSVEPYVSSNGCGLRLQWDTASSSCPNSSGVSYNIYRATALDASSTTFTPSGANRIARCVPNTFYEDASVTGGTTYHYIVRAEDGGVGSGGPCNGGVEESNRITSNYSAGNYSTLFREDFEGDTGLAGWTTTGTGAADWRGVQNCSNAHSGVSSFRFGGATCTDNYAGTNNTSAVTPLITVPPGSTNTRLVFYHRWMMYQGSVRDGLQLQIEVNGGAPALIPDTAILLTKYTATLYVPDNSCAVQPTSLDGTPTWNSEQSEFVRTEVNLDAVCGGGTCAGKTIKIHFKAFANCSAATNAKGWEIDDVTVTRKASNTCSTPPATLDVLAASSRGSSNLLEWLAPAGSGQTLTIRFRTDQFPVDTSDGSPLITNQAISASATGSVTHNGVNVGTTYFYTAFVSNGTGTSGGKTVKLTTPDTSAKLEWVYVTGAATLAPPLTTGSIYVPSNDRVFHALTPGVTGGTWPAGWIPTLLNAPSQARPPVIPYVISTVPATTRVAFVPSQDGRVRAVNASTGAIKWTSTALLGDGVQASPVLYVRAFDSAPLANKLAEDIVLVGSRSTTGESYMWGLNAQSGTTLWTLGLGTGIGIINNQAVLDMTDRSGVRHLYFSSRQRGGGSLSTVWAIQFSAATASVRWSRADIGDVDSSLNYRNGVVYVGTNQGAVRALNSSDGTDLAGFTTATTFDGPVKGFIWLDMAAAKMYFSTTGKIWQASLATGALDWSRAYQSPSVLLKLGSKLYFGAGNGRLWEYDVVSGVEKSITLGDGTATLGAPSYDNGSSTISLGSTDGTVYCVSAPL